MHNHVATVAYGPVCHYATLSQLGLLMLYVDIFQLLTFGPADQWQNSFGDPDCTPQVDLTQLLVGVHGSELHFSKRGHTSIVHHSPKSWMMSGDRLAMPVNDHTLTIYQVS